MSFLVVVCIWYHLTYAYTVLYFFWDSACQYPYPDQVTGLENGACTSVPVVSSSAFNSFRLTEVRPGYTGQFRSPLYLQSRPD